MCLPTSKVRLQLIVCCRCGAKLPDLPSHNIHASSGNFICINCEDISHVLGAETTVQFRGRTSGLMVPATSSRRSCVKRLQPTAKYYFMHSKMLCQSCMRHGDTMPT
jgi:hypothetical protein